MSARARAKPWFEEGRPLAEVVDLKLWHLSRRHPLAWIVSNDYRRVSFWQRLVYTFTRRWGKR